MTEPQAEWTAMAADRVPSGRLRQLRTARGWSQARLAEESGIDVATISRYENDDANPTIDTLDRLARSLGCDLSDLVASDLVPFRPADPSLATLLGQRVRAERTARDLSLSALSLQSEVDARSISRLEAGETGATLPTFSRLAEALKLEVVDLLRVERRDPFSQLSPLEQELLSQWRRLSPHDRSVVSRLVRVLEPETGPETE